MFPAEPPPSSPIRVLYIDDEPLQLRVTKQFVEELDESIVIEAANSPKEVLRLIDIDHFDCILSDYQMPEVNGIELAQKIREKSDVPIIMISSIATSEHAADFPDDERVPIAAWISKPIQPAVLLKTVRRFVD